MRYRFLAATTITFILLFSSFALAEKGGRKHGGDYYCDGNCGHEDSRCGRQNGGLPPGLARKGHLPSGMQKQLVRRGCLPPGLQKRVVSCPYSYAVYVAPYPRPYPVPHYRYVPGRPSIQVHIRF